MRPTAQLKRRRGELHDLYREFSYHEDNHGNLAAPPLFAIKAFRRLFGLTLAGMAALTGMEPRQIKSWEEGNLQPSQSMRRRLAAHILDELELTKEKLQNLK